MEYHSLQAKKRSLNDKINDPQSEIQTNRINADKDWPDRSKPSTNGTNSGSTQTQSIPSNSEIAPGNKINSVNLRKKNDSAYTEQSQSIKLIIRSKSGSHSH